MADGQRQNDTFSAQFAIGFGTPWANIEAGSLASDLNSQRRQRL